MGKPTVTDMPGLERYMPFPLAMFGFGWLVGAEAAWYWGALVMVLAAAWQLLRNRRRKFSTIIDDKEE